MSYRSIRILPYLLKPRVSVNNSNNFYDADKHHKFTHFDVAKYLTSSSLLSGVTVMQILSFKNELHSQKIPVC